MVSFYNWFRLDNGLGEKPLHLLNPRQAMNILTQLGRRDKTSPHHGHYPFLVQFGGLKVESLLDRNITAMLRAAAIAKRTLRRCVIGNSDDMKASHKVLGAPCQERCPLERLRRRCGVCVWFVSSERVIRCV